MRFHLGLRGKLMVVSLCSVIVAVGGVIFINTQLAQRAFTQWFAEEVTTLAKEVAADFGGAEALDDRDTLIQKIYQIQEARPEVQHISIFVRSADNEWQLAATDADPPTVRLGRQDVASLMRDRTRVDIQTRPEDRLWVATTLNALVREVLQLTSPGMARHHVDLHMRLQADLPLVLADPNQLQQVFLNLIANALDAMPTGGELSVETASAAVDVASTTQVLVRIRDTGSGIAPEHLHKLFTPFFTTKNAGQGTGIGLAVCRQIMHAHGGNIEAQSQPGVGSTFTLSLPTPQSKVEKL